MNSAAGSPRVRYARHALLAVSIGCALLTGCSSSVTGQAVRDENAAPMDAPPLKESQLDDVLLSIGDINDIMGSDTMEITGELDQMVDHSGDVSEPDCLGSIFGAEEPVYGDSGYTAVRDQVSREPDEDNAHWVEQTAVLYPSANKAQRFFDNARSSWDACAGTSIAIDDGMDSYTWQIEDLTATDTVLTQITAQDDADGWECQHALSAVTNVIVEAWACSYGAGDEAADIAAKMVENAVA
ncbi:sensor domain-containing protein [Mycolicibacterium sp. P9-22]|uniref:sensor domain-containing protein n=1 Tax=Mycolicibacterium sp. P9-22 TaxID=2024613 RepID=UPI0018839347|nr:sensor domain-containing protein [Mycolicibacterium sp. P9-22]